MLTTLLRPPVIPKAGADPSMVHITQYDEVVDGISVFVKKQVPDFVVDDHPKFVAFLEAYYEWLQQKKNPYGRTNFLMELSDVDTTLDEYMEYFKSKYLLHFPVDLALDKDGNKLNQRTLMKNIKDFYRAKGSEKSYKLLFRVLYDSEIEIYHPRIDVVKASDGKWIEERSLKLTSSNANQNKYMENRVLVQRDKISNKILAYADVDRVLQYQEGVHDVTEVFLSNIVGTFVYGNDAFVEVETDEAGTLKELVYGVFGKVDIQWGGQGYEVGDFVQIPEHLAIRQPDLTGWISTSGGRARVKSVGRRQETFTTGAVRAVEVDDFGINFTHPMNEDGTKKDGIPLEIVSTTGKNFRAVMIPQALCEYAGWYRDNSGQPSSNKKLQDGYYYQDFSYVIKSEISLETFREPIKKLLHPAGTKVFGDITIVAKQISDLPTHSEFQAYERPVVGHYTPYSFKTRHDARGHAQGYGYSAGDGYGATVTQLDRYPAGFNPNSTAPYHNYGTSGGLLLISGTGLGSNSFSVGQAITGSVSGATAQVFEWSNIVGTTSGNLYLMNVTGLFNVTDKILGPDHNGKTAGLTASISTDANGNTGIKDGRGIVIDGGITAHDHQGLPLGTAGVEGYTAAVNTGNYILDSKYGWAIHNHPNARKIFGIDGLSGSTGHGASMGVIVLREFFLMPTGYHFHSNPGGVTAPYYGSTGDNNEYSQEYR